MILQLKGQDSLQDEDYARFARFYLANCDAFDEQYMLHDALLHLIHTIQQTHLLLFDDEQGHVSAFIQYHYTEDQRTAFIESAVLAKKYRSSRAFFAGLRDVVLWICQENPEVQSIQFYAVANNRYTNRLYSKFAVWTDIQVRNGRTEHVYTADLDPLLIYLKIQTKG